jgi:hypothetical protein
LLSKTHHRADSSCFIMPMYRQRVQLYNLVDRTTYPVQQDPHFARLTTYIEWNDLYERYNILLRDWHTIYKKYRLKTFFDSTSCLSTIVAPNFYPIPKDTPWRIVTYERHEQVPNILHLFELPFFITDRNSPGSRPTDHIPRGYRKRIKHKLQRSHFSTLDKIHPWDRTNNVLSCYNCLVDLSELSCSIPFLLKTRGFTVGLKRTRFVPYHISEVRPSFDGILPIVQELRIPKYVSRIKYRTSCQFQFPQTTYWGWNYSTNQLGYFRDDGNYSVRIDHTLLEDFTKWEEEPAHRLGYISAWGNHVPFDTEDFYDLIEGEYIITPHERALSSKLFALAYHEGPYSYFIQTVERVFSHFRNKIQRAYKAENSSYNYTDEQRDIHDEIDNYLFAARSAARNRGISRYHLSTAHPSVRHRAARTYLASEDNLTDFGSDDSYRSPERIDWSPDHFRSRRSRPQQSYHGQTDDPDQDSDTDSDISDRTHSSDRSHNGSPIPPTQQRRLFLVVPGDYALEHESIDRGDGLSYKELYGETEEAGF